MPFWVNKAPLVERIGQSFLGSQGQRNGKSMQGLLPGLGTIGKDGLA